MQDETPVVKPEIVFIEDLLDEIAAGRLRIPRFQRPYVWKPSDMLDLFDSIYKGYPIGSLLLWESSGNVESTDVVGPITIEKPRSPKALTYILDGHQRLATLFGCLRLPSEYTRGPLQKDWRWWVWFDLESQEFRHLPKGAPRPALIAMRSILKTVAFLEEARRIQEHAESDPDQLIRTAELLARKVKNYKMAVTRIEGGGLGQAVQIFSRLNTMGLSMTLDQMVSALTYREGTSSIDLARRIDGILEQLSRYRFGRLKRLTIFRAIVAAADKEIQNTKWEEIAKEIGATLKQTIDAAESAILASAKFLSEELKVVGDELLPYTNQMLMLSRFFQHCPSPKEEQADLLKSWFWSTSFSGWFAGANTTEINNALKEMRRVALAKTRRFKVMSLTDQSRPFPSVFDMRGARVRALLLVMLRLKPRSCITGKELDAGEIISAQGNYAYAHVYRNAPGDSVSNPANRILCEPQRDRGVRDRLRSLPTRHHDQILESHAITEEAYRALRSDQVEKFIHLRAQRMEEIERDFMAEIGVPPFSSKADSSSADVDLDAEN